MTEVTRRWSKEGEFAEALANGTTLEQQLATAQAEAEALRKEVEALRAEMARRDANENRNCINWGPCSRHDKRMTDPDDYAPERNA